VSVAVAGRHPSWRFRRLCHPTSLARECFSALAVILQCAGARSCFPNGLLLGSAIRSVLQVTLVNWGGPIVVALPRRRFRRIDEATARKRRRLTWVTSASHPDAPVVEIGYAMRSRAILVTSGRQPGRPAGSNGVRSRREFKVGRAPACTRLEVLPGQARMRKDRGQPSEPRRHFRPGPGWRSGRNRRLLPRSPRRDSAAPDA
jgi:hypothetical protein